MTTMHLDRTVVYQKQAMEEDYFKKIEDQVKKKFPLGLVEVYESGSLR